MSAGIESRCLLQFAPLRGIIGTMRTKTRSKKRGWILLAPLLWGHYFSASAQEKGAEELEDRGPKVKSVFESNDRSLEKEFVLRERLDAFFAAIQSGKVNSAFEELLKGSKIGEKKENVDELVKNTNAVLERFGKLEDSELIRAERVGGRVIRLSYLSYGADFPLQWQFYCYRGSEHWQILDINVNNDLDQIFGKSEEKTPPVAK